MKIPITIPYFDETEEKAVRDVVKSGWVTQGPQVLRFEEQVAEYLNVQYAVATTSATTALFLSIVLLGIKKGDEVIVPSFTFIATANIVVQAGAIPIFADIDYDTLNIDPIDVARKITKKTRAIIPVDYVGVPCELSTITKIAKQNKLFVIEDAAPAIGSTYNRKRIGSFADLTCFSFHARKVVTTGEGGMITTNNKTYANRARILRHHGMSVSDLVRHSSKKVIHESYEEVGYNFRMSDLEASVGVAQMKKIDKIIRMRTKLAHRYSESFKNSELIKTPVVPHNSTSNWQSYIIKLKKNKYISRDSLMQKLLDDGISTRRGAMAVHQEKAYKRMVGRLRLPVTEKACDQTITLPLYPQMTDAEQEYVIEMIFKHTKF